MTSLVTGHIGSDLAVGERVRYAFFEDGRKAWSVTSQAEPKRVAQYTNALYCNSSSPVASAFYNDP